MVIQRDGDGRFNKRHRKVTKREGIDARNSNGHFPDLSAFELFDKFKACFILF